MNYVGIDYHKKYSHVTAVDEEGRVIRSKRLENRPELFQEFFKRVDGPSEAVLEASRTWGVMYDLLEDLEEVESVELAHSLKVRAIAEAKIKTDKIDSHILAQLLRRDRLHEKIGPPWSRWGDSEGKPTTSGDPEHVD